MITTVLEVLSNKMDQSNNDNIATHGKERNEWDVYLIVSDGSSSFGKVVDNLISDEMVYSHISFNPNNLHGSM